jgi:hypothetical protein
VERVPAPCAIGRSKERIDPQEAILVARLRARAAWVAMHKKGLDTQSDSIVVDQGELAARRENALLQWDAQVRDVAIVAVWRDTAGRYEDGGDVWALACPAAQRQSLGSGIGPRWLWLTPPRGCVVASCGPTLVGEDQQTILRSRAHEAVAEAVAVRQRVARWTSDGQDVLAPSEEVDPQLVQAVSDGTILETWLDVEGQGPMGDGGRLYGLYCRSGASQ